MMMTSGCCCTEGTLAVIWLLPGVSHWVAAPLYVHVGGEAVAIGATARAAAPARTSGVRYLTLERMVTIP
jgi:hypothetical protein